MGGDLVVMVLFFKQVSVRLERVAEDADKLEDVRALERLGPQPDDCGRKLAEAGRVGGEEGRAVDRWWGHPWRLALLVPALLPWTLVVRVMVRVRGRAA